VTHEHDGLEPMLRAALDDYASHGIRGRRPAVRDRVLAGATPRARRSRRVRRVVLALAVVAALLALATGAAIAAGVLTQPIVQVPVEVWQQHFAQEHHGSTGKGTIQPAQVSGLAEAERRAGFHVRTLQGVDGAELVQVTSGSVVFQDGSREPEVDLEYQVGDTRVSVTETRDPHPNTPLEVPGLAPNMHIETIGGSQYLFQLDTYDPAEVRDVQFKTTDGVVFSVNFFGPHHPDNPSGGPGGVDHAFAVGAVRGLS
jgi:hypothetical protein